MSPLKIRTKAAVIAAAKVIKLTKMAINTIVEGYYRMFSRLAFLLRAALRLVWAWVLCRECKPGPFFPNPGFGFPGIPGFGSATMKPGFETRVSGLRYRELKCRVSSHL